MQFLGMDVGSWPAWISALITSPSVGFAAASYRRSVQNDEREQIAKFSCWVDVIDGAGIVHVKNASDTLLPYVGVRMRVMAGKLGTQTFEWRPLKPNDEDTRDIGDVREWAIRPNDHLGYALPTWTVVDSLNRVWVRGRRGKPPRQVHRTSAIKRFFNPGTEPVLDVQNNLEPPNPWDRDD